MLLRRLRLTSLLVLCVGVIVAALNMTGAIALELPHRAPGPLRLEGGLGGAQGRVAAGEVRSSTVAWLHNDGDEPIVVAAWEPIDADGLVVVGAGLANEVGGFVGFEGYPPVGASLPGGVHDLPYALPPAIHGGTDDAHPAGGHVLVVGLQREAGRSYAHLAGMRLTYTVGDDRATIDVPIDFAMCEGECP